MCIGMCWHVRVGRALNLKRALQKRAAQKRAQCIWTDHGQVRGKFVGRGFLTLQHTRQSNHAANEKANKAANEAANKANTEAAN